MTLKRRCQLLLFIQERRLIFFALRVDVPASSAYTRKLRPREERSREQVSPSLWWGWDSEPKEGGSGTEVPCPPRSADASRDGGWSIWGWA